MRTIFSFLTTIAICATLCSCYGNSDEDSTTTTYDVNGLIEIGPFAKGTTVTLQPLSDDLSDTGVSLSTTVSDNAGTFSFTSLEIDAGYAKITVRGNYYNMFTDSVTKSTVSMKAVSYLSGNTTINANFVTDLIAGRVATLMSAGKTYYFATQEARTELMTIFGLQRYSSTDFTKVSISTGSEDAAALIAITALIEYNRTDLQVIEYLSKLNYEFAPNGTFSTSTMEQIKSDRTNLKSQLTTIAQNLVKRYKTVNKTIEVLDLRPFFDFDSNGTAGDEK